MSRVERHAAEEAKTKTRTKKRKGRVTPFGRFLDFIGTIIILATVLLILGLAAPKYAGIPNFAVDNGSMEPAVPLGSMVYAKEVGAQTLKTGDIIVFYSGNGEAAGDDAEVQTENGTPVVRRVIENHKDSAELITKGDANEQNDANPVPYSAVIGVVLKQVPYLGYLASPLSTMTGKACLGLLILAGILLIEVGSRLRKKY